MSEIELAFKNQLVKISYVIGLERDCALKHSVEENSQAPYVCIESLITLINDYLWSQVSWSSALLFDYLLIFDESTHSEVTELDSSFSVH